MKKIISWIAALLIFIGFTAHRYTLNLEDIAYVAILAVAIWVITYCVSCENEPERNSTKHGRAFFEGL